ncbi:hypothetical protein IPC367_18965 [Pseudomonas aeruginosa]|uniref:hypothetical protein n=1 Tax=Pseudomonas aeruginosa group TaxID=136841 RepID=UPI0007096C2E|nr:MULTISPECIES: hypothetical protein [Pseudomonas aeruginosa group]EMB4117875.1 hypothetical protein [Pseudomonas aeruginosa]MDI3608139.1 hypothetical protein [Pseudomonas aeruginosa]MDI3674896.1 hypothetical protein [Pseudomonas aeruginosa]MDI3705438.1 hypothetical protein [Pseudomonas aeruginosa]MDI3759524.1 hypothetical protein [Pseudomonas aeruginosa]
MLRAKRKEGEAVESTALPAEVLAALEGASFHQRQPGDDGEPRIVVQPAGLSGWVHGDNDAERLSRAFPELTEAQLQRACRYLASLVRNHSRMVDNGGETKRSSWVNRW